MEYELELEKERISSVNNYEISQYELSSLKSENGRLKSQVQTLNSKLQAEKNNFNEMIKNQMLEMQDKLKEKDKQIENLKNEDKQKLLRSIADNLIISPKIVQISQPAMIKHPTTIPIQ